MLIDGMDVVKVFVMNCCSMLDCWVGLESGCWGGRTSSTSSLTRSFMGSGSLVSLFAEGGKWRSSFWREVARVFV